MTFESIKAFFGIRPKQIESARQDKKLQNVKTSSQSCDVDSVYNVLGVSSRATFLASQNIQSKKAESGAPLTEVDVESLKQELLNFCKEDKMFSYLNEEETTNILNAITQGATKEIALNRLENFKKMRNTSFLDRVCDGKSNASFILDNVEDFEAVFNRDNCRAMMADLWALIDMTDNKQILNELKKYSSNPKEFVSKAQAMIYDSKEHDIKFGDENVVVDTAFLVHLLSEYQDWRGYEEFNEMVENLTEKNHRNSGELNYYKLAEGILRQKPELNVIVNMYKSYINIYANNTSAEALIQKRQEFFEMIEQKGYFPKEVELRTIVPDKNALFSPQKTCQVLSEKGII